MFDDFNMLPMLAVCGRPVAAEEPAERRSTGRILPRHCIWLLLLEHTTVGAL
jgi:hypothetical protein